MEVERHRPRRMARIGDGLQPQPAHLEDGPVLQDEVVGGEHPGVGGRDRHRVAGVADGRNGLDVVPVAVGLDDLAHPEFLAHLEEQSRVRWRRR